MLAEYKYCMSCGTEAMHPYNLELFNHDDEQFVYIRCTKCKNELRHLRPPEQPKRQGGNCKCGGKLTERKTKSKPKPGQAYYYTHILGCDDCGRTYLEERHKVYNN